jgi:hypothetical protein
VSYQRILPAGLEAAILRLQKDRFRLAKAKVRAVWKHSSWHYGRKPTRSVPQRFCIVIMRSPVVVMPDPGPESPGRKVALIAGLRHALRRYAKGGKSVPVDLGWGANNHSTTLHPDCPRLVLQQCLEQFELKIPRYSVGILASGLPRLLQVLIDRRNEYQVPGPGHWGRDGGIEMVREGGLKQEEPEFVDDATWRQRLQYVPRARNLSAR